MAEVSEQRVLRLQNVRYGEREYWNARYTNQPCEFDWFYGYTALRKVVRQFVKRSKLVLHVGCGNSNFQEGMATDGYQLVNTDISEVVINQMRKKHAGMPGLRYVVSDCRDMPEFLDCQFGSVIDKGTVDALLCSQDASADVTAMFREISRVLLPGGTFLLITLGGPAHRLPLVNRPEFGWSVQVCLVRRVPDSQFAPSEPGRPIPLNDTPRPLSFIGPLPVNADGTLDGLPDDFEPAHYFYAYACRKAPLVLGGTQLAAAAAAAQAGAGEGAGARVEPRPAARAIAEGVEGRVRLPEGWCNTVRAVAQAIRADVGLPPGILGRGRRVRTTTRASFERQQQEREAQAVAASGATLSAFAAAPSAPTSGAASHGTGAPNSSTAAAAAAGTSRGYAAPMDSAAAAAGVAVTGNAACELAHAHPAGANEWGTGSSPSEQRPPPPRALPHHHVHQSQSHVHATHPHDRTHQHQDQGPSMRQGGSVNAVAGLMDAADMRQAAGSSAHAGRALCADGTPGWGNGWGGCGCGCGGCGGCGCGGSGGCGCGGCGSGGDGGTWARGVCGEPGVSPSYTSGGGEEELVVVVDDGTCSAPQLDLHGLHESVCGASGGLSPTVSDSMAAVLEQLQHTRAAAGGAQAGAGAGHCTSPNAAAAAAGASGAPSLAPKLVAESAASDSPPEDARQQCSRRQAIQEVAGVGGISFRRLSITVSDAFEALDKVDGAEAGEQRARQERHGAEQLQQQRHGSLGEVWTELPVRQQDG